MKNKLFLPAMATIGVLVAVSAFADVIHINDVGDILSLQESTWVTTFPATETMTFQGTPLNVPSTDGGVVYELLEPNGGGGSLSDYLLVWWQGGVVHGTFTSDVGEGDAVPPELPTGIQINTVVTVMEQSENEFQPFSGLNIFVENDIDPAPVPDGGITALLLGMGSLGLGFLRRALK